jgi:predicted adenine nucleotide alpha hydrolase (AANH) superfamily ATPase
MGFQEIACIFYLIRYYYGRNEGSTMNKRNYQKELEAELNRITEAGTVPTLLLHSCCAPCSSYVLEYLSDYFRITVLYYNPNIYPEQEYRMRAVEQQHFIERFPAKYPICYVEGNYDPKEFYACAKGMEQLPEGGERCFACYRLRLLETVRMAQKMGCDYFATTLSISPLKNAEKLNEIGEQLAEEYGVRWLPNDFKKKNGYKRSTELSSEYGMYRQDYCGCVFSLKERHPEVVSSQA